MYKNKIKYNYDKNRILNIFDSVVHANQAIANDYHRSVNFVNQAFDDYSEARILEPVSFAFLIPMRVSRHSSEYWEDVIEFLPILKYLDLREAYNVMTSLPPCKIEFYGPHSKQSNGVVIMAPIFGDMVQDYRTKIMLLRKMRKKIQDTVDFAHRKFQVEFIGLGGMLPKITNYGKTIKTQPGVVVTTGHAGTISLLISTFENIYKTEKSFSTIGVLGGGSIGRATLESLAASYPDIKFIIYDKREDINNKNKKFLLNRSIDVRVADNNKQLIDESEIIISAITKRIPIKSKSLKGKIIIDDSQPGSFDKQEVESLGGSLIWVVGNDSNKQSYATRRNNFSYGPYGLVNNSDLWGCEAEVAMLSYYNKKQEAINHEVTQLDIKRIRILFKKYGIKVANYQAFGKNSTLK